MKKMIGESGICQARIRGLLSMLVCNALKKTITIRQLAALAITSEDELRKIFEFCGDNEGMVGMELRERVIEEEVLATFYYQNWNYKESCLIDSIMSAQNLGIADGELAVAICQWYNADIDMSVKAIADMTDISVDMLEHLKECGYSERDMLWMLLQERLEEENGGNEDGKQKDIFAG